MQVQTPFYVIKRMAVTKDAALEKARQLAANDDHVIVNLRDMIDFCLADPKEEKVFLSIGDKVRLKDNGGWLHYAPTSGEAVLGVVTLAKGLLWVQFNAAADCNAVYPSSADLSDYVELI